MSGNEALMALIGILNDLGTPYITTWCTEHGTLEILAKAREEAGV